MSDVENWIKAGLTILAVPAAIFGAFKGGVELYRIIRPKWSVDRGLTDSHEIGNTVWINNLSDRAEFVVAWDIVWAKWTLRGRKVTFGEHDAEFDEDGFLILARSRKRYDFKGQYHFPTDAARRKRNGTLYLRLWTLDRRRPRWFKLL
jgi:hypothetical protein